MNEKSFKVIFGIVVTLIIIGIAGTIIVSFFIVTHPKEIAKEAGSIIGEFIKSAQGVINK